MLPGTVRPDALKMVTVSTPWVVVGQGHRGRDTRTAGDQVCVGCVWRARQHQQQLQIWRGLYKNSTVKKHHRPFSRHTFWKSFTLAWNSRGRGGSKGTNAARPVVWRMADRGTWQ
jgi:hypothetical protein